jgi:hypothetical protein
MSWKCYGIFERDGAVELSSAEKVGRWEGSDEDEPSIFR